jgi:hypothetical protein
MRTVGFGLDARLLRYLESSAAAVQLFVYMLFMYISNDKRKGKKKQKNFAV